MNLPSDLQRLLPYIAIAVLAVVGLVLVLRGIDTGGGGSPAPEPGRITQQQDPRPQGDAGSADRKGSDRGSASQGTSKTAPAKRSAKAYVSCVEQATDTAALGRCQAYLPRR